MINNFYKDYHTQIFFNRHYKGENMKINLMEDMVTEEEYEDYIVVWPLADLD